MNRPVKFKLARRIPLAIRGDDSEVTRPAIDHNNTLHLCQNSLT